MPTYSKRKESSLVTAIGEYLQTLENAGIVAWWDRLNAGYIKTGRSFIRMCRAGTPDLFCILNNAVGQVIWIEAKQDHTQSTPQKQFEWIISGLTMHRYILIHSVDELRDFLKYEFRLEKL
jgi:hypothetical protein